LEADAVAADLDPSDAGKDAAQGIIGRALMAHHHTGSGVIAPGQQVASAVNEWCG
jgi:hypothetical protein